jgi:dTDP-4-amino-4,6-dideoxygalactose transaminase
MGGRELALVGQAFESGYVAPLGPMVDAFEAKFAEITGIPHCAALTSGTAALHLALRLLGVGPGDTVAASTLTFVASVAPAVQLGAEVVLIDSDRPTWNMDPTLLARALDELDREGRRPKAVIPTDLYGQCADYDRINEACARFGIPVVADAAEAVGSTYKGRHAGAGAAFAAFSFNGNKIVTTSGGGMLASADGDVIAQARRLSQQARDPAPHYEHSTLGYNYRLSNILAAIGLGQLAVLPERVRRRRAICEFYRKALAGLPGIEFMPEADYGRSNRWLSVVLIEPGEFGASREDVRLALEAENIESRPLWKPMHMQPALRGARVFGGSVAEDLFARGLCLPSGTQMTDGDLAQVAEIVTGCGRGGRA